MERSPPSGLAARDHDAAARPHLLGIVDLGADRLVVLLRRDLVESIEQQDAAPAPASVRQSCGASPAEQPSSGSWLRDRECHRAASHLSGGSDGGARTPGRVIQPLGSTRTRRAVDRSAVLAWPHRRTREPEHQGWWTSLRPDLQESGSSDDPERLLRLRCSARGSHLAGADELERTLRQELDIVLLPFAGQQSSGGGGRRGCAPGSGRRIGDRSSGRRPRRQTRRERMSTTIRACPVRNRAGARQ